MSPLPPPPPSSLELSLRASTPCIGHLVALRTKAEARATFDLIQVYVVEVQQKAANALLRCVKALFIVHVIVVAANNTR